MMSKQDSLESFRDSKLNDAQSLVGPYRQFAHKKNQSLSIVSSTDSIALNNVMSRFERRQRNKLKRE